MPVVVTAVVPALESSVPAPVVGVLVPHSMAGTLCSCQLPALHSSTTWSVHTSAPPLQITPSSAQAPPAAGGESTSSQSEFTVPGPQASRRTSGQTSAQTRRFMGARLLARAASVQ